MKDIWVPLSGAIAEQRNVDTIANNVANANTPGFKRDQLVFKEYLTALEKQSEDINLPNKDFKPQDFYHTFGAEKASVKVDGNYTDFTQGQLRPTNNPLDLAISGNGFFEVLAPNGVRFTRRGTFALNRDGLLVTEQGYPVLSKMTPGQLAGGDNRPQDRVIRFAPTGDVSVTFDGSIYQAGNKIGVLSVTEFKDVAALKKEGAGLFINNYRENLKIAGVSSSVRQGFVEESNVNAVTEMSALINAQRHFESIQKAMKSYDSIANKGVNEIAKF